ncbi:MAG: phosphate ABC transporter permease subunit PstC [Deltaproteobacteria bacterium]|nr:phosphate ABC transporter permease subunit PstC [Deltaproteobacteria bacterium]
MSENLNEKNGGPGIPASEANGYVSLSARRQSSGKLGDAVFKGVSYAFALSVIVLMALLFIVLVKESWLSIKAFGFSFIYTSVWDPVAQEFGALPSIYGTLVSSIIAIVIAVPISLGIAIFLTEMAPKRLKGPIGTAIELLASIPSIIYGMWGLFVFAPFLSEYVEPFLIDYLGFIPLFTGAPLGIGMLPAGFILAIMIIPFISSVSRDIFQMVPSILKESGYGVGATKWEVIRKIVLPYARSGVIGAVILGLGRALGETMAVTFLIGNAQEIKLSLLEPATSISATLANEFTEAVEDLYLSSLVELGLILFIITFIVLALAKLLISRFSYKGGQL